MAKYKSDYDPDFSNFKKDHPKIYKSIIDIFGDEYKWLFEPHKHEEPPKYKAKGFSEEQALKSALRISKELCS